jgi:hypothetical protein
VELKLILRGLFAGLVGGVLAFVFARIFAEPQIQKAIDYEDGRHTAQERLNEAAGTASIHEHADPFSRAVQSWAGLGSGVILFSVAMGGLFALAFIIAYGRVGSVRARALSMLLALGAFLAVFLVPFLKYPGSPPAVGNDETIGARTALYLAMLLASLAFAILAVALGLWLHRRKSLSASNAALLAAASVAVAIGIVMVILPPLGHLPANVEEFGRRASETPLPLTDDRGAIVFPGFPADVLFYFRLYSVGAALILWGAIGLVFGPLAERLLERVPATVSTQSPQNAGVGPTR